MTLKSTSWEECLRRHWQEWVDVVRTETPDTRGSLIPWFGLFMSHLQDIWWLTYHRSPTLGVGTPGLLSWFISREGLDVQGTGTLRQRETCHFHLCPWTVSNLSKALLFPDLEDAEVESFWSLIYVNDDERLLDRLLWYLWNWSSVLFSPLSIISPTHPPLRFDSHLLFFNLQLLKGVHSSLVRHFDPWKDGPSTRSRSPSWLRRSTGERGGCREVRVRSR